MRRLQDQGRRGLILRRPSHLVRRFFEVLRARPLDDAERSDIESWIGSGALAELFYGQQVADQRHGYDIARAVASSGHRPDLVAAAAMHDVGKRHSQLGAVARSVATVLMALRVPLRGRMAAYRDHGPLGADDLEAAGASGLTISFARHHQHRRPGDIPLVDWAVLNAADLGTLPRGRA